jgi:hypothetical protein
MAHLMTGDEKYQAAAKLGAIGRDLRLQGHPLGAQQDRLIDAFLEHVEALEEAQVKLTTDLVKALADLSAELRAKGKDCGFGKGNDVVEYYDGKAGGYYDAAAMVDALSTGPVMQATLDALDARTPE